MTKRQIEEMIKNMGKTKIISEKSNKYHEDEEKRADDILKKYKITINKNKFYLYITIQKHGNTRKRTKIFT